ASSLIWSRRSRNNGSFKEKTKVAVCEGVNPCTAREREKSPSSSRTELQAAPAGSSITPLFRTCTNSCRNLCDCDLSSSSFIWPERREPAEIWLSIQDASTILSCVSSKAGITLWVLEAMWNASIGLEIELG